MTDGGLHPPYAVDAREAPGKGLLVLFFRKELLPS
jgi:hypothetical protein